MKFSCLLPGNCCNRVLLVDYYNQCHLQSLKVRTEVGIDSSPFDQHITIANEVSLERYLNILFKDITVNI